MTATERTGQASHRIVFRVLTAGMILQLAFGLVFAWGSVVPYVLAQEHWSAVLVGAVFSGTPLGYGIGTLIAGRLADVVPPQRLCWVGMGLLAIGFAVAFFFPTGLTFVVFYAVVALGLGGGFALSGAVASAVQVLPLRAGTVGGAMTAAYAAAAAFEAPLISQLAPRLGWLDALRVVGIGVAAVAAVGLCLMPSLPSTGLPLYERRPTNWLELLRQPLVWSSTLVIFLGSALGAYAAVNLVADAAVHRLTLGLAAAGLVGFSVCNSLSRLGAGISSDRFGVGRVVLAVLGLDLIAGLLLWSSASAAALVLGGLTAGTALGGGAGVLSRMARDVSADRPQTAFGILFAGYAAGAFCGPLLGATVGGPLAWLAVSAPALIGLGVLALRARFLPRSVVAR